MVRKLLIAADCLFLPKNFNTAQIFNNIRLGITCNAILGGACGYSLFCVLVQ
jgi:hypothetical protein